MSFPSFQGDSSSEEDRYSTSKIYFPNPTEYSPHSPDYPPSDYSPHSPNYPPPDTPFNDVSPPSEYSPYTPEGLPPSIQDQLSQITEKINVIENVVKKEKRELEEGEIEEEEEQIGGNKNILEVENVIKINKSELTNDPNTKTIKI